VKKATAKMAKDLKKAAKPTVRKAKRTMKKTVKQVRAATSNALIKAGESIS